MINPYFMKDIVIGIGEVLWDVFPHGRVPGGAPANFAYHVSQLGCDGRVVSAVGDDEPGKDMLAFLESKSLGGIIEKAPYPTGTVQVEVDGEGIPQYEICRDVAWDHIPFTPDMKTLARQARAVCFGTLAQRSEVSRQTIHRFLDQLPTDALVVFDINLRQQFFTREIIAKSLVCCNILKINDVEVVRVATLFGWEGLEETVVCRRLLTEYKLQMVALTRGTEGSYLIVPGDISFLPTPRVKVADTVGAGDAFTAALVASLLKGMSIAEAHQAAVDLSAYVCTQHGAMSKPTPKNP